MANEGVGELTELPGEFVSEWISMVRRLGSLAESTPEPEFWLAKLRDLERWIEHPADIASRLIDLLVTSKRDSVERLDEIVAVVEAGQEHPNPRAAMLLDELVCTASYALIILGTPARDALLRAYASAKPGARERRWFLITMSRMGDSTLEPFFDTLKADDFDAEQMRDPVKSFRSTFEHYCAMDSFRLGGVEAVYAAAQHKRQGWREAAIYKLGAIGDERAVETLRSLLKDPDEAIRGSAQHELAWIEEKRSRPSDGSMDQ